MQPPTEERDQRADGLYLRREVWVVHSAPLLSVNVCPLACACVLACVYVRVGVKSSVVVYVCLRACVSFAQVLLHEIGLSLDVRIMR